MNKTPKMTISQENESYQIHPERDRFPFCIVWTPMPILTWLLPFLGHMGIAASNGVIFDFAGPYYVSEGNMAFGKPTKYWQFDAAKVQGGTAAWDRGVREASEIYKTRMHNLCCDNCHSHVSKALNLMRYNDTDNYNMVNTCFLFLLHSKYVSVCGFIKTWLPFMIIVTVIILLCMGI